MTAIILMQTALCPQFFLFYIIPSSLVLSTYKDFHTFPHAHCLWRMQTGPATGARWAAFGFVSGHPLVCFRLFFVCSSLKTHLRSQREWLSGWRHLQLEFDPRDPLLQEENSSCPLHAMVHARAQTQINYFWKKSFELFQFFLKFSDHFIHAHNISLFRTSPIPILPPQSSPTHILPFMSCMTQSCLKHGWELTGIRAT